jgi:DNA-K related protein/Hsp70 protein
MELSSRYLIGIDLGTTNSAVAYIDTGENGIGGEPAIHPFRIPQLIAEGEVGSLPVLPSFLYITADQEGAGTRLRLPWQQKPTPVIGVFARDQGALVPGRQVSSAKSWLCHDAVDRTAKILPWGTDRPDLAYSPVEASSRYLSHIRDAWNYVFLRDSSSGNERFELQEIVLTVPASFDEEARELTVQAARDARLQRLTLLEEPLAAFYSWMAAHHGSLTQWLRDINIVLVCDVGGGTTDFSLIRVHVEEGEDNVGFERTAIGEHLLLGGDNIDLALAHLVEEKLGHPKLTIRQRAALRRQCCAAKEMLLTDPEKGSVPVTILGSGRSVVGGAMGAELSREEVKKILLEGFLPVSEKGDIPSRDRRSGLRELSLPYATEPSITKHLARFLTQSSDSSGPSFSIVRPDAILFNGGFFSPELTRHRIVETIIHWFRAPGEDYSPKVLANKSPESAVALGAAYYSHIRLRGGRRIRSGSGRSYFIGLQQDAPDTDRIQAVCIMPRFTEEGTTLTLRNRDFAILTNRPVSFTLYSSTTRNEQQGDLVLLDERELHRHAPLITMLRYGKKSRQLELPVHLTVEFTEVGTLELWCESRMTTHRWRLQFQLRGAEPLSRGDEEDAGQTQTVIPDEVIDSASSIIRALFSGSQGKDAGDAATPETITSRIESALGYGKDSWPMAAIRRLCDVLLEVAEGRRRGPRYEGRWLNIFGFCLRPGFGSVTDELRITQAWHIYLAGLVFSRDIQCLAEWLILWRRVAGGLNAGQQKELYQRHSALLGIGGKKRTGPRNPQVSNEGWRMIASLEHLPVTIRTALGEELIVKISRDPANKACLWSLGRIGARIPLYGPLSSVVPPETAAGWLRTLLDLPALSLDAASAVIQLGSRTDDRERDIHDDLRQSAIARLSGAGIARDVTEPLRRYVPPARADALRIFGESLPEGLKLVVKT